MAIFCVDKHCTAIPARENAVGAVGRAASGLPIPQGLLGDQDPWGDPGFEDDDWSEPEDLPPHDDGPGLPFDTRRFGRCLGCLPAFGSHRGRSKERIVAIKAVMTQLGSKPLKHPTTSRVNVDSFTNSCKQC